MKEVVDLEITVGRTLDARGEICPWPVMLTMKEMQKMPGGEVLEVLIDHTPSLTNIPAAAKAEGHDVLSAERVEEGVYKILIRVKK